MTAPRYAALASKLLAHTDVEPWQPPSAVDRAAAVGLVEVAIRKRRRRGLALRWSLAVAAAGILAVGAGRLALHDGPIARLVDPKAPPASVAIVGHPIGEGATVVDADTPAPLTEGKRLGRGTRIKARPKGHFVLSLSTGTQLTVEEDGEVSVVESGANQVFALRKGAVLASVSKLVDGERFIIRTADSEVEVRGTSFRVATAEADPNCEDGAVTRVSVFEGIVSVRHAGREARVAAGESWPRDCAPKLDAPGEESSKTATAQAQPHAAVQPPAPSNPPGHVASDLGEQNDVFAAALAAKRRGATTEAISRFEAFMARYPSSSLVEGAMAQRMQLLRGIDPGRASEAASQYLARFPKGFARADAQAIVKP